MTTVVNPAKTAAARVVLPNVSWETYERLLSKYLSNCSVPHLTYDQGRLEIMGPTAKHEKVNRNLERRWIIYYAGDGQGSRSPALVLQPLNGKTSRAASSPIHAFMSRMKRPFEARRN